MSVNVLEPSVDVGKEDDVGFSDAVGEFDSIIDTIGNEQKGVSVTETGVSGGSTVLQLLRSRHKCDKYMSTLTKAQELIKGNGVFFGPGKANDHIKKMQSLSPKQCIQMIPSAGFGPSTLQTLLEKNIVFSGSTMSSGSTAVRGWSLKEFWEESSWPRDSSGADVRYGLPVIEDEEFDDLEEMFRRQKDQIEGKKKGTRLGSEGGLNPKEEEKQTRVDEKNPYVTQIRDVDGLSQAVTSQQRDSLIFVAMRSCRTCKSINPIFTRMAREGASGGLLYAKADATGREGKALGKKLNVASVPSIVLFKRGVRYGAVGVTKLPSEKLDRALQLFNSGEDFDPALEDDDD